MQLLSITTSAIFKYPCYTHFEVKKMVRSNQFREYIRILVRKLGILDKVTHNCSIDITLPQCHAMVEIGRHPGISLKELASKLNIDVSTTSRTVEGLVKKGLALRIPSESDRRYINITLNDSGIELFQQTEESMFHYYSHAFERIPSDKQEQVLESLSLMIHAFTNESEES